MNRDVSPPADMSPPVDAWYAIAASEDLVPRHLYQTQLFDQELVAWRADDGFVNVWENRCLHRGVRLSLGSNEGGELICRYHGWRYANRNGGCTYIPAHPENAPARTICSLVYPAVEHGGLVWTTLMRTALASTPPAYPPPFQPPIPDSSWPLRALPCNAPAERVSAVLLGVEATSGDLGDHITVQPVGDDRCVIRPVLDHRPSMDELKRFHRALDAVRSALEGAAANAPRATDAASGATSRAASPQPAAGLQRVGSRRPERGDDRHAVTVTAKTAVADGVVAFTLAPTEGATLPVVQPGGHVDVYLPDATRQYSLVNAPGETQHYVIGVKREPAGRGGSAFLHDRVEVGDVLTVSAPRHRFPLRRDATRTVLISGGIGITPIVAMAQALAADGCEFEHHHFAQTATHVAFADRLDALGERVVRHLGLDAADTVAAIERIVANPGEGGHLYVCGPAPMIEAACAAARRAGWPEDAIHVEFFANPDTPDLSSTFTVELARRGLTVTVPTGVSVLDALRAAGVEMPSACGQGACGTCIATVVEGTPQHQDVYLTAAERAANDRILTCVSRSHTDRLVLDL